MNYKAILYLHYIGILQLLDALGFGKRHLVVVVLCVTCFAAGLYL